jgi:hypothetical protein
MPRICGKPALHCHIDRREYPRMKQHALAAALCCGLLASALVQGAAATKESTGRSYKWVDENGVTHYGDSVPPQYARQSRSELNSQGVEVSRVAAQMSPEEAAAAQQAAAEESRRRQHDMFLLNTYTTAADIEQLRDERVALVEQQMAIARGSIESANGRLQSLATRMAGFKPYSDTGRRRVPDQLAEEAVRAMQERRSLDDVVAAREKEKSDLRTQFDADLARYRELTSNRLR